MSIYEQIKDSLVKQNKVLQVDYLGSKIIENSRNHFQQWDHINPITKKQLKLWEYLQKEELHQQKYFRFKKSLNKKHFGLQLPEKYRNSTILTQKQEGFLYSTKKMASIILGNSTMDTSGRSFFKGTDSDKENIKRKDKRAATSFCGRSRFQQRKVTCYQKQKDLSRYWPLQDNESITFQSRDSQKFSNQKHSNHKNHDSSIYNDSLKRSINQSFANLETRPLSRQLSRHADKVKNLVQKTINPEIRRQNIRHTLKSMTEKNNTIQKKARKERKSILDAITNRDQLMDFLRKSQSIDPKRKGIFTLDDLTDFEKFNLSFSKYMELKSLKKINNYAYEHKVKQKSNNLQKFQNFILQQFTIESDNKRKLEKIFEQIKWQFSRTQRLKQAQRR